MIIFSIYKDFHPYDIDKVIDVGGATVILKDGFKADDMEVKNIKSIEDAEGHPAVEEILVIVLYDYNYRLYKTWNHKNGWQSVKVKPRVRNASTTIF